MAYASLVCLTNILEQNLHLNLIPQNSQYIESLLHEVSFFQNFLEKSSHKSSEKVGCLETRIRDTAYKALDIIDSNIAYQLLDESTSDGESFTSFLQDLDEVMEEINSIKQEVMQIEEDNSEEHDLQSTISSPAGSLAPPSHGTICTVGLDDDLMEIKTRLLRNSSELEIVSLVGMGGIGKTTLATKIYDDSYIVYHYDIRIWATVSQEYNVRNILLGLLGSNETSEETNEQLAEKLYKRLKGIRFFIVLDDLWDTLAWDYLRRIFPNDKKGSRILLTTRLEQVAKQVNSCPPLHRMRLLNDDESWSLFCKKVFKNNSCPLELEEVGKEIVRNCRGLPLEVNVIGGHLSRATRTQHYWRGVAKNLNETIALEDDEQCSRVLYLSYKHLPQRLKGCFLYMGIFPEDYKVKVSMLLHLWIASGLIKQEKSKSFEDVYEEYFLDLTERNLILVSKRKYNGKITFCKLHDLLRDLCVKEAKSEKFFHISGKTHYFENRYAEDDVDVAPHSRLKALCVRNTDLLPTMVHLRYLCHGPSRRGDRILASSVHQFLYLHTIHVRCFYSIMLNIWEMPQLRNVKIENLSLPDPPAAEIEGRNSVIVLEKLETLYNVHNLICTEEVLRRIPNLKKLRVYFVATDWINFYLNNLERLHELKSLRCTFYGGTPVMFGRDIIIPPSIKKLALYGSRIPWKDMTVVGSLPNLQVLKLRENAFIGEEWEPNGGEFLNLKTLHLEYLFDLVHWRAYADHFPQLQHLSIYYCRNLLEIPSGVGEIPTLELIDVQWCRESVASSARQIEDEQRNFGNEGFQLNINKYFIIEASFSTL